MKACVAFTSYFGQNVKKIFLEKKIALLWVTNGTVKIQLLNDHVCSITHELNLVVYI